MWGVIIKKNVIFYNFLTLLRAVPFHSLAVLVLLPFIYASLKGSLWPALGPVLQSTTTIAKCLQLAICCMQIFHFNVKNYVFVDRFYFIMYNNS